MFRDILSNKGVLAGSLFCIFIVVGSLLYSWHVERGIKADEARTQQFLQQREIKKETRTAQDAAAPTGTEALGQTSTPLETDDTQTMSDETDAFTSLDAFLPDETGAEETTEVPVSPFGFGPYPEVPADYFGEPIWGREPSLIADFPSEARKNIELIDRVLVKLWQQGDREIVGGSTRNGKIYPHYDNVVYVRWREYELPDGSIHRYVSSMLDAGEGPTRDDIRTGKIPPNFKVIEFDDAGFDPYQFLNISPMEEY